MKSWLLTVCVALQVVAIGARTSVAQEVTSASNASPVRYEKRLRADFRLGGTWSKDDVNEPVSVGGSLAWQPSRAPFVRRVGLYLTVDYRQLGYSIESNGLCAPACVATTDHWVATNTGISVDLIRTRRLSIDLRGGIGSIDDFRTVTAQKVNTPGTAEVILAGLFGNGQQEDNGPSWENQCDIDEFRERCLSQATVARHWGLGARFFDRTGTAFFGVDYSQLRARGQANSRHQLVGVFGVRFPFRVPSSPPS